MTPVKPKVVVNIISLCVTIVWVSICLTGEYNNYIMVVLLRVGHI